MKRRDHDGTYKLLFSNPQMVRDLMAFVDEPWVEELDFSTLKQAESSLVGKGLKGAPTVRETDLLWRVETRGGQPVYVYLLIELQSTVDLSMALRLLVYVALLYQRLYEKREPGSKEPLPPVMPFVLYNGARKWTAARDVFEMIAPGPEGLETLRPRLSYLLIDDQGEDVAKLAKAGNVVAAMFELERSRGEGMREILSRVAERFEQPGHEKLEADFLAWMNRSFLPSHFPAGEAPVGPTLEEIVDMLPEGIRPWYQDWRDEGRAEGRKEGRREGRKEGRKEGRREGVRAGVRKGKKEGEAAFLERLLLRRFGELPADVRGRLQRADSEELLRWGERCLSADSLSDVFDR